MHCAVAKLSFFLLKRGINWRGSQKAYDNLCWGRRTNFFFGAPRPAAATPGCQDRENRLDRSAATYRGRIRPRAPMEVSATTAAVGAHGRPRGGPHHRQRDPRPHATNTDIADRDQQHPHRARRVMMKEPTWGVKAAHGACHPLRVISRSAERINKCTRKEQSRSLI
jgi:hypothetical protein